MGSGGLIIALSKRLDAGSHRIPLNGSGRSNEIFNSFRLSLQALAKPETMAQGWRVNGMPGAISRLKFTSSPGSRSSRQPIHHPSIEVNRYLGVVGPLTRL